MGPISSVFYTIGFTGVFFGLTSSSSSYDDDPMILPAAAIAAIGLSLMMAKAAVYHAAFAYTCFLSKEISATIMNNNNKKNDDGNGDTNRNADGSSTRGSTAEDAAAAAASLHTILELHQSYLRYIYKWAVISCIIGSAAFAYCCLAIAATTTTGDNVVVSGYPRYSVLFVPAMSAPLKKILKRYGVGGIVLCGGLTNLWNLCYFAVLYLGFSSPVVSL